MQSPNLKITAPDGRSWTVPLSPSPVGGAQITIGRAGDNNVVLDQGDGVSSHHCVIGRNPMGTVVVHDRGSTNGTWIDGRRAEGPTPLAPGAKLFVGSYLLTLELPRPAQPTTGHRSVAMPMAPPIGGRLLTKTEEEHEYQRLRDRVTRYAQEWDKAGRPSRLLVRGRTLKTAETLLDGDHDPPLEPMELDFIRASRAGVERGKLVQLAAIAAGALAVIGVGGWALLRDSGEVEASAEVDGKDEEVEPKPKQDEPVRRPDPPPKPDVDQGVEASKQWYEHTVVPAETLEEIALRYDVSLQSLERWNGVGGQDDLTPGQVLKVKVDPNKIPLPAQQITYIPERRESWSSLAKRFDVPVAKLRAYNPNVGEKITAQDELTIWISPKPLKRRENVEIPTFEVRQDAVSIGAPHDGKLENAIQFPENDALYKRRAPNIMWCGSHMAKHLQDAIASFRHTYEFEGEMVVADMSQRHGGHFDPHKSHQAGRDVDIWLPTLKGVYKRDHLLKERKPYASEADWFALYGFVKALHATGEVHAVFLDYSLHERVYKAAKLMGATDEELDAMIAYPKGQHNRSALLQHSDGHIRHIHVRFKCGPMDVDCSNTVRAHEAGD